MSHSPLVILGHTDHSKILHKGGLGEISNARKFCRLLEHFGESVPPLFDLYDLFGGGRRASDILWRFYHPDREKLRHRLRRILRLGDYGAARRFARSHPDATLLVWSWDWITQGLINSYSFKDQPLITRLLALQADRPINPDPHARSDLIMSYSPLAIQQWIKQGLDPSRVVCLPPHYIPEVEKYATPSLEYRAGYLSTLSELNRKPIPADPLLVGIFSRFPAQKNTLTALRIARRLHARYPHVRFVFKGRYDPFGEQGDDIGYTRKLRRAISEAWNEPWFLWDYSYTPHPEFFQLSSCFDLFLHPTGSEGALTPFIEAIPLRIPAVMLDCTSNPTFFRGMAKFIRAGERRHGLFSYHLPDEDDAVAKVSALIENPEERAHLAERAYTLGRERFSPELNFERSQLMLEAARTYHSGTAAEQSHMRERLLDNLRQEFGRFQLESPL